MVNQTLLDMVNELTPEEQESVREFVSYLKQRKPDKSAFVRAAEEFIAQHPALLERLAR